MAASRAKDCNAALADLGGSLRATMEQTIPGGLRLALADLGGSEGAK